MNDTGAVPNGIGQAVKRKEDLRFLTGQGSYGDDLRLPGLAHAVLVRSPHAHARIVAIDKSAALRAPGVLAVLTGADYIADGLSPIPHNPASGLAIRPTWQCACAAERRSQRPITRCRPTRRALSARPSRWSSPKPSPRPRTRPSWST